MMSGKLLYVWAVLVLIGSVNFVHSAAQEGHIVDLDSNIIDVDFEKSVFNPKYEHNLKKIIDDKIKAGKNEEEIQLIIELDVFSENYIDSLEEQGVIVEKNYRNLVQVKVKARDVENLVKNDFIKRIKTPIMAYPDVVSQGVQKIGADALHALSITGEGVKVAVLDGGFLGYGDLLGTELPASVTTMSFRVDEDIEAGRPHGTACAEIIHDVAPNAYLYLVNFESLGFYEAIDYLILEDVDIISFSMSFFLAGPGDGTGLICEKVDEAADAGILFVTSAGNYATSHYEGTFLDSDSDYWNEFSLSGDETIEITAGVGEVIRIYMSWSASWPTVEDYDLFLFDSGMSIVASSENDQSSGWYPVESIYYAVPTSGVYRIAVWEFLTTSDWELEIFCPSHDLDEHQVASGSVSTPTDAYGAFSVGATYWGDDSLEYFSSWGPTNDGRVKPDICAPDGVSTDTYTTFWGTSASAPHVAGAAALLLSYHPSLTVAQIKSSLGSGAIDYGTPGEDNLYGAGRIDVYESYVDIKYVVTLPVDFGAVIVGGTYIQTDVITAGSFGNTITITAAVQSGGKVDALEELRYVEGTVTGASGVPLIIWDEDDPVSSWTAITLDAGEQLSLEAYAGLASGTWGSIVITLTVS